MSGTEAAATLSLEIKTVDAVEQVNNLKTAYVNLHAEMGKTPTSVGAGTDAPLKDIKATLAGLAAGMEDLNNRASKGFGGAGRAANELSNTMKIMLRSAEMTGNAIVKAFNDADRAAETSASRLKSLAESRQADSYFAEVAKYEKRNALIQALDLERYEAAGAAATKLKALEESRQADSYFAEVAKYEKRNALIQALDLERYEAAGAAATKLKALEESRQADIYFAEVAKYEKRNALIQALDLELYNERAKATARLKTLQESRDMEVYTETVRAGEAQLALERKYILASEQQRLKAAIDARKLMDAGYAGNLSTQFAPQTLATAGGSSVKALEQQMAALSKATAQSSTHMMHWNTVANESHAAARGLSGALGGLWMTYGSLAPLLAGAALAGSMKQVFTIGKELEFQFTMISAISGGAVVDIEKFSKAVEGTMFTPVEAAKGLRVLAQAGLSVTEATEALPAVLKLAAVGETDMATAALSATAIMHSFGLEISDFGHIGDVFGKAAAMSATSVTAMMEAMKQASSISNMFGVSLEETAAALATLANRGIEGSAAGTAIRNMTKELASPATAKAADAMKQYGIEVHNADGTAKSLTENLQQLSEATSTMTARAKTNFLEALFNERGVKAANILLNDMEKMKNTLEELKASSDGLGFMNEASIKLSMSLEGMLKTLKGDFQRVLAEVFSGASDSIKGFVATLSEAVNSKEFKGFIESTAHAVIGLTKAFVENISVLKDLAIGYVAFKGFEIAAAGVAALGGALANLGKTLAVILAPFRLVAVAVGFLAYATYEGYKAVTGLSDAQAESADAARSYATANQTIAAEVNKGVDALQDEGVALKEQIRLMKMGASEADAYAQSLKRIPLAISEGNVAKAKAALDAAKSAVDAGPSGGGDATAESREARANLNMLVVAQKAYEDAEKAHQATLSGITLAATNAAENQAAKAELKQLASVENFNKRLLDIQKKGLDSQAALDKGGQNEEGIKRLQKNIDLAKSAASLEALAQSADSATVLAQTTKLDGMLDNSFKALERKKVAAHAVKDAFKEMYDAASLANAQAAEHLRAAEAGQVADKNTVEATHRVNKALQEKLATGKAITLQDMEYVKLTMLAAQAADVLAEAVARENEQKKSAYKFREGSQTIGQDAETLMRTAEATRLYGDAAKQTASQAAEFAIQQMAANTQVSEADKAYRRAQAALKDYATGYKGLVDVTVTANKAVEDAEADGILMFAEREDQKLAIQQDRAMKRIDLAFETARKVAESEDMGPNQGNSLEELERRRQEAKLAVVREYNTKLRNVELKDWKETVTLIEGQFKKGFMSMFDSGKKGWKEMTDAFKNMFKNTVLEYIYKEMAKPFVLNVIANVAGVMGMSGMANAASSMAGGAGGVGGLLSTGNSAYNLATGGASSMYTSFATSSLGSSLGLSTPGLMGPTVTGEALSGLTTLGTALPYVGAALAAVSLISGLFGDSGPVDRNSKYQRAFGASDSSTGTPQAGGADPWRSNFRFSDSEMATSLASYNAGLIASEQNAIKSLGLTAEQIDAINVELNKSADAVYSFGTEHTDWMESNADEMIAAVRLQAMSVALGKSVAEIAAAMDPMFGALVNAGKQIGLTADQLVKMAGTSANMQALTGNIGAYYAAFYSDSEKVAKTGEAFSAEFDKLGLAMPETKAAFRSLVESLDLTTDAGQKSFSGLMALSGGFAQFVDAAAAAGKAALDAAAATAKMASADRKARLDEQRARAAAAQTTVAELTTAYADLQSTLRNDARGTSGGSFGTLGFSAGEYDSVSKFADYVDNANAKLDEIAKSPFASELAGYTTQIKALAKSVQDQAADVLYVSRLQAGDVAGAVAAQISKTPLQFSDYLTSRQGARPDRSDFTSRSDFDAAFAKWDTKQFNAGTFNHALELAQVKAMVEVGNYQSANALSLPNVSGGYSAASASEEFKYSILADISKQYGIGTQTALQDVLHNALGVAVGNAIHAQYTSKGPGIASVQYARAEYADAIESKYIDGRLVISRNAIAYSEGVRDITLALKNGKISAEDYSKGLEALTGLFGGGADDINAARLAGGNSAERLAAAGAESINFYFGKMADGVAALSAAAAAAAEPVALVAGSIGRMNSASAVFGQSAQAVADGFMGMMGAAQAVLADAGASDGQRSAANEMLASGASGRSASLVEGSAYRNATLVSMAAGIASGVMTTQAAAEAAKKINALDSFSGSSDLKVRDTSLMLDGLRAFDAVSLENTFNKLSNALATKKITEAQYVDLFNLSISTFTDETKTLTDTFGRLRDTVKSLADALLVGNMTTLNPAQQLAEAQRQYAETLLAARNNDPDAIAKLDNVTKNLLNIGQLSATNFTDYATLFGTVIGDLRGLEALGVAGMSGTTPKLSIPAFAAGGSYQGGEALVGENGPELINFNRPGHVYTATQTAGMNAGLVAELKAMREELAQLRADNNNGNAAVINATKRSAKALEKWDADGMPAVTA